MNKTPLTVQTTVNASLGRVWEYWTKPEHITKWAFASDDWEARDAQNDVRTGGKFKTVMGAKDKSESFDFEGTYSDVKENELIEYDMSDGRHVKVEFSETPEGTKITETFEPFPDYTEEQERSGWQAILNNFKKHVESET